MTFNEKNYDANDRKIDKFLTNKITGIPIMIAMLAIIFWITIVGANYPSEILFSFFNIIGDELYRLFEICHIPPFFTGFLLRRRI